MSYRLPSLNGLRAFEASARHLSFKRAADELSVTPGAVSQQVKSLEARLGVPLFRRLPRGLLLTAKGESYFPAISSAFRAISAATDGLAPALKGRKMRVAVSPTLSPAIEKLLQSGGWPRTRPAAPGDLRQLIDGKIDALLRGPAPSPPGLHVDRIELRTSAGSPVAATLVTLPGLAGCREHKALLKFLSSV